MSDSWNTMQTLKSSGPDGSTNTHTTSQIYVRRRVLLAGLSSRIKRIDGNRKVRLALSPPPGTNMGGLIHNRNWACCLKRTTLADLAADSSLSTLHLHLENSLGSEIAETHNSATTQFPIRLEGFCSRFLKVPGTVLEGLRAVILRVYERNLSQNRRLAVFTNYQG